MSYESHYRLKKLKCSVLPLQKAQDITIDSAEAFIAHHKGGSPRYPGVRGSSMTTVTRLPTTINGGTGLARKLGLLVGFRATSGEVEVQGLDCC